MVFETTAYADSAIKPTSLLDHKKRSQEGAEPKNSCDAMLLQSDVVIYQNRQPWANLV